VKLCEGAVLVRPAETVVSASCVRIPGILISVFASLFAKREWDMGQRPEKFKKRETYFANALRMNPTNKEKPLRRNMSSFLRVRRAFALSSDCGLTRSRCSLLNAL
jgi:hypothetical protein